MLYIKTRLIFACHQYVLLEASFNHKDTFNKFYKKLENFTYFLYPDTQYHLFFVNLSFSINATIIKLA